MAVPIAILELGARILDKVIPDPKANAEAKIELMKQTQAGEFKEYEVLATSDAGQVEINKIEAASDSLYKSGWRPAVGWTCAGALFYQLLFRPIFGWIALNAWGWSAPPSLELETLLTLLFGLLGLGAYRTVEKVKRVT